MLFFTFTIISDVYRSFIPNKTTFTKYCVTWVADIVLIFYSAREAIIKCLPADSFTNMV